MKNKNKTETRRGVRIANTTFKAIIMAIMFVYAISLLIPLIWMLYSSVKPYDDFLLYPFQLPKKIMFSNYAEVFQKLEYTVTVAGVGRVSYGLGSMLFYSFVWSASTNFISVFFYILTSYVISKYKFKGRNFIYAMGIFLMILPIIGTAPASFRINKAVGLYDNMIGRILTSGSGAFYGFNFILLYGAWKSVPWEFAEASFLDGGGHVSTFFRVMMPMIIPSAAVIFILGFLGSWNDYLGFLTWLPSYPNLAVGMYMFQYNAAQYMVGTPTILAGFTVVAIPTTVLYLLSQKVIMAKLNVGGLKG